MSQDEAVRLRYCDHSPHENARFIGVVIGLATGFRRGEVLGLQWKHIHFGASPSITVEQQLADKRVGYEPPKTKTSVRTIAIDRATADTLAEWKKEQAAYLVPLDSRHAQTDETPVVIDSEGNTYDPDNYGNWFRSFCVKHGFGCYTDQDGNELPEQRYNDKGFPIDEKGRPYSRSNPKPKIRKHYDGLKFHELRHTHITLQIGNGVDFKTVSMRAGHNKTSTTMDIYSHFISQNDQAAAELIGSLFEKPVS